MDDCISREAVKELYCRICMDKNICYRSKDNCEDLKLFDKLPSVTPERPHGHWKEFDHGMGLVFLKCSRCGEFQSRADNHNFCPNCGADMRGEQK